MKVNKAGLHYGILIIVILIAVYMGMEWYKKEEGNIKSAMGCTDSASSVEQKKCLNNALGTILTQQ